MKSAVELWEDMELQGGEMGFGSFYLLYSAVEIWEEAKEEAEIWDVTDDATDQGVTKQRRTVEIWAEAEDVTEIWEDKDDVTEQGETNPRRTAKIWAETDDATGIREDDDDVTEQRGKNQMQTVFWREEEEHRRFEEVEVSPTSKLQLGNLSRSGDDGAMTQGRRVSNFQNSKWREKNYHDGVSVNQDSIREKGFLATKLHLVFAMDSCIKGAVLLELEVLSSSIHMEVEEIGDGKTERELSVSNWWWRCNGFEETVEDDDLLGNLSSDGGAAIGGGGAFRELTVSGRLWWCNGFEIVAGDDDVVTFQNSNFELVSLYWVLSVRMCV